MDLKIKEAQVSQNKAHYQVKEEALKLVSTLDRIARGNP